MQMRDSGEKRKKRRVEEEGGFWTEAEHVDFRPNRNHTSKTKHTFISLPRSWTATHRSYFPSGGSALDLLRQKAVEIRQRRYENVQVNQFTEDSCGSDVR